ncbi:MAG TPA: hypothetical protein PKO06_17910, partial [Candidatus Ozemobacteraceae bacterium]|nr:hypothetical protein [Candidatus Ozemobacteraceae bacterium]
MGCLKRFLLCGCAGTLALVFLAGGILGLLAQSLRQNSLQARSAPVKTLFEALNSDGPAWVRVRLEPASASEVLRCGETPAVWVSFQGRELVTQEIRRGGAWRMRSVWKKPAVEARTVPVLLKTDAAQFLLTDWLGVEPWPDLFQRRRITDYLNAENGPRLAEE